MLLENWELLGTVADESLILREDGDRGRYLFRLRPYPGLHGDRAKALKVITAAPILLKACESALDFLESTMDEAGRLDHDFDGHESEDCPLCLLREAIQLVGK